MHARLLTRTKAFCRCETVFGEEPNRRTCPVCQGWPGALPVLNGEAVRLAVRSALAFRARVDDVSRFDRKNYFYPDLPKGYQITQAELPLARGGYVSIFSKERGELTVRLERLHMEEDAGRSAHHPDGTSRVDLNRAGAPLVEIVTAPDLRTPDEAIACFTRIRQILLWAGTCDGNMEEGSIRCDANISVSADESLGTRTEVKNLNSFRFLGRAIEYEAARQIELLESGGRVTQETRAFDPASGETRSMRSKEEAKDYRYFPEPDLPALVLPAGLVDEELAALPEMPDVRASRYRTALGFEALDAEALAATREVSDLFDALSSRVGDHVVASNWVRNEVLRLLKQSGESAAPRITVDQLADLIDITRGGLISSTVAREVFDAVWGTERMPRAWVEQQGLAQVRDEKALRELITTEIASHPAEAAGYLEGRVRLLGFFVGRVMKETDGKADPKMTSDIVREILESLRKPQ